jgi:hypothetical protein
MLFLAYIVNKGQSVVSFEVLRTINGVVHDTFKLACIALGLYDSDDEWNACLEEAVGMQTGAQLQSLFVTILAFGVLGEPLMLWDKYKEHICDDCKVALQRHGIVERPLSKLRVGHCISYEMRLQNLTKPSRNLAFLLPLLPLID